MGKRQDLFGHDERDDEQIRKDNDAYFNRNKNKSGGFKGLTEAEKKVLKKGVDVVKKSVKKVGKKVAKATTSGAKTVASKVSKVKDYGAHVAGTVIGKTERAVKRGVKKIITGAKVAKFVGKLGWKSLKAYDKKTQARKKKPKFNMDTKEWE